MKLSLIIICLTLTTKHAFTQKQKTVAEAGGLIVGEKAPIFSAIDADSSEFNLSNALMVKPVVLIFYRGFWCPYCNKHLATVQDSLELITEKGAQVIAVSPENPEYLEKMVQKTKAKFKLLYDKDYKIAKAYKVNFTPNKKQLFVYNTILNGNLNDSHSNENIQLPIPATYIIDQKGIVVWKHEDPDYKNRSTMREILDNLP